MLLMVPPVVSTSSTINTLGCHSASSCTNIRTLNPSSSKNHTFFNRRPTSKLGRLRKVQFLRRCRCSDHGKELPIARPFRRRTTAAGRADRFGNDGHCEFTYQLEVPMTTCTAHIPSTRSCSGRSHQTRLGPRGPSDCSAHTCTGRSRRRSSDRRR